MRDYRSEIKVKSASFYQGKNGPVALGLDSAHDMLSNLTRTTNELSKLISSKSMYDASNDSIDRARELAEDAVSYATSLQASLRGDNADALGNKSMPEEMKAEQYQGRVNTTRV